MEVHDVEEVVIDDGDGGDYGENFHWLSHERRKGVDFDSYPIHIRTQNLFPKPCEQTRFGVVLVLVLPPVSVLAMMTRIWKSQTNERH